MKIDCFAFAFTPGGKPVCGALNEMLCVTRGRCGFYANKQKAERARERAQKRARERGYIPGKYLPTGGR